MPKARHADDSLLALLRDGGPAVRRLATERLKLLAAAPDAPGWIASELARAEPPVPRPLRRQPAHPAIDAGEAALARLGAELDNVADTPPPFDPFGNWRWETDAGGRVVYEEGEALAAMVSRLPMTEGAMADAMALRIPFFGARCEIGGRVWELNGLPYFDGDDFAGYRGVGWPGEDRRGFRAPPPTAEALALMAHEVRSPLNAILGFAQLIESEALGPVPAAQRADAARIVALGGAIVTGLEDLLEAARVGLDLGGGNEPLDLGALVADAIGAHGELAAERGCSLVLTLGPAPLWAERAAVERLSTRLVAAVVAVSTAGETIAVETRSPGADRVVLRVARPGAMAGISGEGWLDGEGEGATSMLVSLGFALRLVRELAQALGGRFVLDARWITVELPAIAG